MRKCSRCGVPIGPLNVCPSCGYDNNCNNNKNPEQSSKVKKIKDIVNGGKLSVWNLLLVIMCNVALILIVLNACLGYPLWGHYAIFGMGAVYFISFTCFAKSMPKFVTRYRNTAAFFNALCTVFFIVLKILGNNAMDWLFNFFVPVNIVAASIVLLFTLVSKNVKVLQVLISLVIILVQAAVHFVTTLVFFPVGGIEMIFSAIAMGFSFMVCLNLGFLYFLKFRDSVCETFRLWE